MSTAPPRTHEQLREHYEVEKELAARLRKSTREERSVLFATLYGRFSGAFYKELPLTGTLTVAFYKIERREETP